MSDPVVPQILQILKAYQLANPGLTESDPCLTKIRQMLREAIKEERDAIDLVTSRNSLTAVGFAGVPGSGTVFVALEGFAEAFQRGTQPDATREAFNKLLAACRFALVVGCDPRACERDPALARLRAMLQEAITEAEGAE